MVGTNAAIRDEWEMVDSEMDSHETIQVDDWEAMNVKKQTWVDIELLLKAKFEHPEFNITALSSPTESMSSAEDLDNNHVRMMGCKLHGEFLTSDHLNIFGECLMCSGENSKFPLSAEFMRTLSASIVDTPLNKMECIQTTTMKQSMRDVARMVFGDSHAFFYAMHDALNHWDVQIDPWQVDATRGLYRLRSFQTKTGAPIGASTTVVEVVDRLDIKSDSIRIYSASRTIDAMFSSDFRIESMYEMKQGVQHDTCILKRYVAAHFIQKVAIWGSFIKKEVRRCAMKECDHFVKMIDEMANDNN